MIFRSSRKSGLFTEKGFVYIAKYKGGKLPKTKQRALLLPFRFVARGRNKIQNTYPVIQFTDVQGTLDVL